MVAVLFAALLIVLIVRPQRVRVEIGTVERGRLVVTVDEEGETRVRDRFVVAAPIAGRLVRMAFDAGDPVQRDTVVARMSPLPLDPRSRAEAEARLEAARAALRGADARVEHARAASAQARRTADRSRQLARSGTIGMQERELAELAETARASELEAAEFAQRAATYDLEAARAALIAPGDASQQAVMAACEAGAPGCLELRSPVDGQVLRIPEKSERVVAAGTPLLELGDTTRLEVMADLLSNDAVKVRAGAPVLVEEWGGGRALNARVRVVEPSGFTKLSALGVEEQRVNVIADLEGPPGPLADGYRVEVRIVVWEADGVLKVPSSALFRRRGTWNVFTIHGGQARPREVEIGQRNAIEAEVLAGLDEGAEVILHPSDQVGDGVRVEPL